MKQNPMDPPCVKLCAALNALGGITTMSSCCGHGTEPYRIWLDVASLSSSGLLLISRLLSHNYHKFGHHWQLILNHQDVKPQVCFLLEGMESEADELADEIIRHVRGTTSGYNIYQEQPKDPRIEIGKAAQRHSQAIFDCLDINHDYPPVKAAVKALKKAGLKYNPKENA